MNKIIDVPFHQRKRQINKKNNRESIITSSRKILTEKGIDNASVREINRSLNVELPDKFVTLSGLIHELAKEIPKVGKVIYYKDLKIQIISRSISKINKVKLSI